VSEQLALSTLMQLPPQTLDEFSQWWEAYPRKVGKPDAKRAWLTARREATFGELIEGAATYQFSAERKYIPHPGTWLRQRRWRDVEPDLAADPWGLGALQQRQPDCSGLSAASYEIEALQGIMLATGLPATWRGPLDALNGWLRDGYTPGSLSAVIGDAVKQSGVPASLKSLDWIVRQRAARMDIG
jgi:hypothetical protein